MDLNGLIWIKMDLYGFINGLIWIKMDLKKKHFKVKFNNFYSS